jgi:hypothetical protein
VVIDNGGSAGTNTPITLQSPFLDLTITNGGRALFSVQVTLASLMIGSNSWLLFSPYPSYPTSLVITGNTTIQASGGISLDGQGFPAGQGRGSGRSVSVFPYGFTGGGGGNAGYGGSSVTAAGGDASGSESTPVDFGSGGGAGNGNSTNNLGGSGGGALHLTVNGTLTLDGRIVGVLGESGHEVGQFNWIHAIACPSENTLIVNFNSASLWARHTLLLPKYRSPRLTHSWAPFRVVSHRAAAP